uniref:Uncharacterized protein n=1 Tax=Oryza nivara TaxID=4536 RepID=A0A0E0I8H7_ORYNI
MRRSCADAFRLNHAESGVLLTQSGLLGTSESEELELMNGKTSDVGSNWLSSLSLAPSNFASLARLGCRSGHTSFSFEFAEGESY